MMITNIVLRVAGNMVLVLPVQIDTITKKVVLQYQVLLGPITNRREIQSSAVSCVV
jgi:hypothetical protein